MSDEADEIAKLVPIGELKCAGVRRGHERVPCDRAPTHRLFHYESPDYLFCEEHGQMWVAYLLPDSLREGPDIITEMAREAHAKAGRA